MDIVFPYSPVEALTAKITLHPLLSVLAQVCRGSNRGKREDWVRKPGTHARISRRTARPAHDRQSKLAPPAAVMLCRR